ncbi:MAG: hypothetical protein H6819_10535 [Phycisphaerales bacterium]|nr:hypothetical protein [Phycisphaerales bacterium]MCB9855935.1 hypothetical protein [Phycisphaerales bacterium]MCB9864084.1 hypothetical protein [Phycisphaerales bacterium]
MALTANRELNRYVDQELRSFGVAASEHIYKGALVGFDRTSGFVRPYAAGDTFAGIAYEEIDNSAGQGGDLSIRLYTQGDFILTVNGAVQNLAGAAVYASNDDLMTAVPSGNLTPAGILIAVVGSNLGIVRIRPFLASSIEHVVQTSIAGSTSAATTHVVLTTQHAIRIVSVQVLYLTPPDQGALDVGFSVADPDDIVNNFNLATLSANAIQAMTLAGRDVTAGVSLLARVGQASSNAGAGGIVTIRYVELP